MSRTDSSGARISPQDVRRKHFSVRLRGVDYGEVRFFLAGLADELEGLQAQLATLTRRTRRYAPRSRRLGQTFRRLGQTRRNWPPTRP